MGPLTKGLLIHLSHGAIWAVTRPKRVTAFLRLCCRQQWTDPNILRSLTPCQTQKRRRGIFFRWVAHENRFHGGLARAIVQVGEFESRHHGPLGRNPETDIMAATFQFNPRKALAGLVYLASLQPAAVRNLDKYKAAKLLFLADKHHVVQYGRPIFGDYYRALPWGPVPQTILDVLHQLEDGAMHDAVALEAAKILDVKVGAGHDYPCFFLKARFDPSSFLSKSELGALEVAASKYGKMTFHELYELTHAMPAYTRAWERRGDAGAASMEYEDFFESDPDAIPEAKEEMLEDSALREALK